MKMLWLLTVLGGVAGTIFALSDPPFWPTPWVLPAWGAWGGSGIATLIVLGRRLEQSNREIEMRNPSVG